MNGTEGEIGKGMELSDDQLVSFVASYKVLNERELGLLGRILTVGNKRSEDTIQRLKEIYANWRTHSALGTADDLVRQMIEDLRKSLK